MKAQTENRTEQYKVSLTREEAKRLRAEAGNLHLKPGTLARLYVVESLPARKPAKGGAR